MEYKNVYAVTVRRQDGSVIQDVIYHADDGEAAAAGVIRCLSQMGETGLSLVSVAPAIDNRK